MMMRSPLWPRTLLILGLICLVSSLACPSGLIVVGGLSREAQLEPGSKLQGRIVLRNNADTPQEVKLYQRDYLFWADGRNEYPEPGTTPRSNARWVVLESPQQFTVPPKGTESIYYTLQVPEQAPEQEPLCGTYWSMLMVEPIAPELLTPSGTAEGQALVGIKTLMRYGIQMVTHLGDTGTRLLAFRNKQLLLEPERRLLQLELVRYRRTLAKAPGMGGTV